MKQHLSNTILAVVLFATAVPLLVLVLTKSIPPLETEPEEKAPAAQKFIPARKKAVAPDDTKELTVKLSAKLNGRGVFVFEGDTIRYRHESEADLPRDVTVDRRKWDDLSQPFKLGYTPDFANAVIRSKKGPNTTKMTVGENRIELVIDDSVYTWPEYDFVIAMKNQVEPAPKSNRTASTRRDPMTFPTNDFVTPPVVGEFPMGGFPFGPMAAQGWQSAGTRPTETVTITLEGTIRGGGFLFEDDSIRFVNRWGYPTGLTVNGVPWTDPKEPFKLDFTPDYASATLLEKDGPGDIGVKTGDIRFSVSIKPKLPEKATSPFATNEEEEPVIPEGPFRLKLAVKKPVPWDVEADEITLTIKGRIYGGKFVFRGNTIVFDSNPRVEPLWPKDITVDGRPWKDLSQPFELGFTPDFAKTVIVEREIAKQRQFRLYSAFPEREFALYVEDAQPRGSIDPELRNISVELFPFQVKLAVKNQLPHLEVLWKYAWQPQTGKDASPSGSPEPNYSITITPADR